MEPERVRKLKSIYDKMANEGGGTWATYMLVDIEEFVAMSVSSPTEPKAGVVSEAMVERACGHLASWGDAEIEWFDHRDDIRSALTAALNGEALAALPNTTGEAE